MDSRLKLEAVQVKYKNSHTYSSMVTLLQQGGVDNVYEISKFTEKHSSFLSDIKNLYILYSRITEYKVKAYNGTTFKTKGRSVYIHGND